MRVLSYSSRIKIHTPRLFKPRLSESGNQPDEFSGGSQFQVIELDGFRLSTETIADSCVLLKDGKLCKTENIIQRSDVIVLVCRAYTRVSDFFRIHCRLRP
jgi:hypothetical protein